MNTKNLKPFDLQVALNGEAVMLRKGKKAYVRYHETDVPVCAHSAIWGVMDDGRVATWAIQGSYIESCTSPNDIICMWPKTRIVNGFEVPAPETEELNCSAEYYLAASYNDIFYRYEIWQGYSQDKLWLERGLVFLNKEDAIANAKAMLGINPYEESEE